MSNSLYSSLYKITFSSLLSSLCFSPISPLNSDNYISQYEENEFVRKVERYAQNIHNYSSCDINSAIDNLLDFISDVRRDGQVIYSDDFYYDLAIEKILKEHPNISRKMLDRCIMIIKSRQRQRNIVEKNRWQYLQETSNFQNYQPNAQDEMKFLKTQMEKMAREQKEENKQIYLESDEIPEKFLLGVTTVIIGVVIVCMPIPTVQVKAIGSTMIIRGIYDCAYSIIDKREEQKSKKEKPWCNNPNCPQHG